MQVTRDEAHTPTAFHANVVAMDEGHLTIEDVARDYVHCTQCGACELRCPNTLFTGDFYRFRTRTVDLVKAVRALAVEHGVHQPNWQRWNELTDDGQERARAERDAGLAGARGRLGCRARPARRGRDGALLRLRGGLLPHERPAGGRPDPPHGRRRVRAHARAVVLRGPGGRDGLRRPGAALRRAQRRRLARGRRQADPRRSTRTTTSPSRRTTRATSARTSTSRSCSSSSWWPSSCGREAEAFRPDRARGHVPRRLPAEQAQGDPRRRRARSCARSRASPSRTSTTSPNGRTARARARGSGSSGPI